MISVFSILKEQVIHFPLIFRLAFYEIKSKYQMHYLGIIWQFLNPFIQVCVYWFIFGIGLRQGESVGDIPYIIWLLTGLIPWFFISPSVVQGANSIYSKVNLVSKMKFPVSILPTITIISNSLNLIVMLAIFGIVAWYYNISLSLHIVQLPYYMLCLYVFLFALTLLSSTISALIRDFQLLIQSIMRLLFFLTPILWSIDRFPEQYQTILKLNPFAYIINGFRNSILEGNWFFNERRYMFYFWSLTLLILFIGSILHERFKNKFVDYL
ncbi:ABC transporter permease [Ornithinibacillus sp. BX22]|uniref:Transport permease protein n=2 Tax=Ornithinibacillus TaxID=484508 RepID=A0A923RII6_9BACI|nr:MULTISPECIES: ABC transporter permease [Ornithinibacillus]MBC5635722.1 ABC transporter permease [Ornithinibacillus hominis]MBS3679333.1 ABC transporter permease [Ornithinibacillus massiliensis]